MKALFFIASGFLIMLWACQHSGMKKPAPGLMYKLIEPGDDQEAVRDSAIVELRLRLKDAKGKWLAANPSIAYESGLDSFVLIHPSEDLFHILLSNLDVGDSISFEIEQSGHLKRKFGEVSGPYSGSLRLTRQWYPYYSKKTVLSLEEQSIARKIERGKDWLALPNGLYVQWIAGGLKDSGAVSTDVCLRYKGGFLNGFYIDNHSETCFEFIAAGEQQLIPGLEWFARRAIPGSRATLIIPHSMAYGILGSSTGIVPPYKTLIFDAFILPTSHEHAPSITKSNP